MLYIYEMCDCVAKMRNRTMVTSSISLISSPSASASPLPSGDSWQSTVWMGFNILRWYAMSRRCWMASWTM